MYRGNKRHHRIFKILGPTMWNFTVRGAIIPNCDGVCDMIDDPKMTQEPQKQLTTLKPEAFSLVCLLSICCNILKQKLYEH